MVNEDGIFYISRAQKLMAGDLWNGVSAYWSPLYSLLVGLVGYPINDFEFGGRIVSLLAGTLLIPLTYYLGTLLFDKTTSLIASLLVATHASLIQASGWVLTEALYGLLFLGMITIGWHALQRNKISYWALNGLLVGLAYLTKPETLAFLLLFLLFTLAAVAANRTDARKLLLGFALMSCVVGIFVVPYVLFLHTKVGEWTISKKASTNTMSGFDEENLLRLIDDGRQTRMDQIWGDEYLASTENDLNPHAAAERSSPTLRTQLGWAYGLFRRQLFESLPALLSVGFLPLILIGLFSSPWTKFEATRNLYLGAFVLSILVGYSFAVTNVRYLFAIMPVLLLWTGYGATVFARWISDSFTRISSGSINVPGSLSQAAIVVILLLLSTRGTLGLFDELDIKATPREERRAGQWLRSYRGEGPATIMASHANVAYYAGAHHLFLPNEELSTVIDYAKRRKTDFIVFSTRRLKRNTRGFPEVAPELERDLELVYSAAEDGEDYSIRVYKVRL